jgi:glyoxylase-like metal-dependent hydrolase (beta-lactamase superfamily II)
MTVKTIVPGLYQVSLGFVNVFLIEGDGLTLIDTGVKSSAPAILKAIHSLGKQPQDVRQILLSHLHGDHVGALTELKRLSGAKAAMHLTDAALVRQGITHRPVGPGPGLINWAIYKLTVAPRFNRARSAPAKADMAPVEIEGSLNAGQTLANAGGLKVVATPGHTKGHLSFLYPQAGGVLILGDILSHMLGLVAYAFIYEDLPEARRSLKNLARLKFEKAVFSHGGPLMKNAQAAIARKAG